MLAAPFEYIAGAGPGLARINYWLALGAGGAAAAAAPTPGLAHAPPKSKASGDEGEPSQHGAEAPRIRAAGGGGAPVAVVRRANALGTAGPTPPQPQPQSPASAKAAPVSAAPRGPSLRSRTCLGLLLALLGCVAAPPLFALSVGSGLSLLYTEYKESQVCVGDAPLGCVSICLCLLHRLSAPSARRVRDRAS